MDGKDVQGSGEQLQVGVSPPDRGCAIPTLDEHQFKTLHRLANGKVTIYCSPEGVDTDKRRVEIDKDHESIKRLIDLGLVSDASTWPKFKPVVKTWADEGRAVVIVALNRIGKLMFQRTTWGHLKN